MPDAELAQLRGGFKFRGLDFDIGVFVRDRLDGREVLASSFHLAKTGSGALSFERAPELSSLAEAPQLPAAAPGTLFQHEVGRGGVVLSVINTASGVSIQRDAVLSITLRGGKQAFGHSPLSRAISIGSRSISDAQIRAVSQ